MLEQLNTIFSTLQSNELIYGKSNDSWDIILQGLSSKKVFSFTKAFPFKFPKYFIISNFAIKHNQKALMKLMKFVDGRYTIFIPKKKKLIVIVYNFVGKIMCKQYLKMYTISLRKEVNV